MTNIISMMGTSGTDENNMTKKKARFDGVSCLRVCFMKIRAEKLKVLSPLNEKAGFDMLHASKE